jgi:hypothetical protein
VTGSCSVPWIRTFRRQRRRRDDGVATSEASTRLPSLARSEPRSGLINQRASGHAARARFSCRAVAAELMIASTATRARRGLSLWLSDTSMGWGLPTPGLCSATKRAISGRARWCGSARERGRFAPFGLGTPRVAGVCREPVFFLGLQAHRRHPSLAVIDVRVPERACDQAIAS